MQFLRTLFLLFLAACSSKDRPFHGPPSLEFHENLERSSLRPAVFVVSVSDSPKDEGSALAVDLLRQEGFPIKGVMVTKQAGIKKALRIALQSDTPVVVCVGGTGIGFHETTIETIEPLFAKRIDGFGEMVRIRMDERLGGIQNRVGIPAIRARAAGGITSNRKLIFAIPNSPESIEVGISEVLVPELPFLYKNICEDGPLKER